MNLLLSTLLFLAATVAAAEPPPVLIPLMREPSPPLIPLRREGPAGRQDDSCGTDSVMNLNSGEEHVFATPGYYEDSNYANNLDCQWNFRCAGSDVILSCSDVAIRSSWNCRKDYLEVSDPTHTWAKYCGHGYLPETELGFTEVDILFHSNRYGRSGGFECKVACVGDVQPQTTTNAPEPPQTNTPEPPPPSNDECGVANTVDRIVGGQTVNPTNQFPWQVRLELNGYLCGGSLIDETHVVTAAHCVDTNGGTMAARDITAILGDYRTQMADSSQKSFGVSRVVKHANYNSGTMDNDIALLTLSAPVSFNDDMRPVCLPAADASYNSGTPAVVSGFGTTSSGGQISSTLRWVGVSIFDNSYCNTKYGGGITSNMICAGDVNGGKDSCQGDSGGPLVVQRSDNRYELAGVVSFGIGCADAKYPGVYARTSRYLTWIQSNK